jgi:hypothetical protein
MGAMHNLVLAAVNTKREGLIWLQKLGTFNYTVGLKYINHYIPTFNANAIQIISLILFHSTAPVVGAV